MPTHQLSIAQLLSAGFEAFKKNLKSVIPFFVALQAIVFLLAYFFKAPFLNILMIPVVMFMQIAILRSFKSPFEKFDYEQILDLKDSQLKEKLWRLLITYIIYIILIVLLFLLLIIPGIIFMVYWYFFSYTVLDQNLSGMAALKKSKEYIRDHWWKTFALFVIAAIISAVMSTIVTSISGKDSLIGGLLMAITSGIISIYFGYVAVAYYFNLKK